MILTIDNLDNAGPRDYSASVDGEHLPKITRKYNQPAQMQAWLAGLDNLPLPAPGGRVALRRRDGSAVFTGYLSQAPQRELLGAGQAGPVSRWLLNALGDECVLDRGVLPARAPIVGRCGGDILKALASELAPGVFDVSGVQSMEMLAPFSINCELNWSKHAAQLGVLCRAAYRVHDGRLVFAPVGSESIAITGSSDAVLTLDQPHGVVNDITILGGSEPQRYVKDYFQAQRRDLFVLFISGPIRRRQRNSAAGRLHRDIGAAGLDCVRSSAGRIAGGRISVGKRRHRG